jgi:hypothetical protein
VGLLKYNAMKVSVKTKSAIMNRLEIFLKCSNALLARNKPKVESVNQNKNRFTNENVNFEVIKKERSTISGIHHGKKVVTIELDKLNLFCLRIIKKHRSTEKTVIP